jgi:hypothetical protein
VERQVKGLETSIQAITRFLVNPNDVAIPIQDNDAIPQRRHDPVPTLIFARVIAHHSVHGWLPWFAKSSIYLGRLYNAGRRN